MRPSAFKRYTQASTDTDVSLPAFATASVWIATQSLPLPACPGSTPPVSPSALPIHAPRVPAPASIAMSVQPAYSAPAPQASTPVAQPQQPASANITFSDGAYDPFVFPATPAAQAPAFHHRGLKIRGGRVVLIAGSFSRGMRWFTDRWTFLMTKT